MHIPTMHSIPITASEIATIDLALKYMVCCLKGGSFMWPTPLPRSEDLLVLAERMADRYEFAKGEET